jgi:uncharacterized membrane protein YfcA
MPNPLTLVLFGILVGVFSGVMGLGGGAVMIPIMVLALAMTQQTAHGTSLAVMIPPVTLPAVIKYYREGHVDLRVAGWMALGVLGGTWFGAWIATSLPKEGLKLVFGFVLIYVAAYTVFGKEHLVRTLALSATIVLVAVAVYGVTRWYDARPGATPAASAAAAAEVRQAEG